ncbi:MAG: hypothetical protein NW224_17585 [Leptolyngbyaceae cyanobacterium bins.302]|nr:hypothetical protein [Leptolyngbyaceae cyanobacterium bins.302]
MLQIFDDPFSSEATDAWECLKRTRKRGDTVSGVVIQQKPFGVFLDAGIGFRVLLEVVQFREAASEHFSVEDYPAVGSTVEGQLTVFTEHNRQVRVSQRFDELENKLLRSG